MIHFNFAFFLTAMVLVSGLIVLLDRIIWRKKRSVDKKLPIAIDYARTFFPVLLLVWIIRSFIIQPYRVPTGSLEPTIMPGDFIAVNQFAYGLRLPVLHTKILAIGEPKRGDIALFRWPDNPKIVFVKRVIGVPGDHIVYDNKTLTINGKKCPQKLLKKGFDYYSGMLPRPVLFKSENLLGQQHKILVSENGGDRGTYRITVPAGQYFMMGDNRDDSEDSRYWGFVPERNFIGRAMMVWMNWDPVTHQVNWRRIGTNL